jgi:hypothetical protein
MSSPWRGDLRGLHRESVTPHCTQWVQVLRAAIPQTAWDFRAAMQSDGSGWRLLRTYGARNDGLQKIQRPGLVDCLLAAVGVQLGVDAFQLGLDRVN